MATSVCPECGRPVRSAAGCPCRGGGAGPTARWELPALEAAVERRIRLVALPAALAIAWAVVHAGFLHMLLRTVLSMWIHELGHATAAWLCGRFSVPGPWFTPVGSGRSLVVVVVVAAAVAAGVVRMWRTNRLWAAVLASLLPLQMYGSFVLGERQVSAFIVWSGDAGCMVIGTLLMLSLYARKQSQLRVGWLRWGFLVIGAAAFADGFATWWAARSDRDAIPFGENEGRGLSDPTVLVFDKGFSIPGLVSSYLWTGALCLVVLGVAYGLGLRKRGAGEEESP